MGGEGAGWSGAPTSKVGMPTYYLAKFSRKLHENERIWTQTGCVFCMLMRRKPKRQTDSKTGQVEVEKYDIYDIGPLVCFPLMFTRGLDVLLTTNQRHDKGSGFIRT